MAKGLFRRVAEEEETIVVVPWLLEVTEVEVEVTIRVGVDVGHTVVAVSVLPEAFRLVKRRVPLAFGQIGAHLLIVKYQAGTLGTKENTSLIGQECHPLFRGSVATHDLPTNIHP